MEIISFLKQVYGDIRPYMQFTEIKALSNELACGFPSGHSTLFIYFASFIWEEYILKRKLFINQKNKKQKKTKPQSIHEDKDYSLD